MSRLNFKVNHYIITFSLIILYFFIEKKASNEIGTFNDYININKTEILFKEETFALSSDLVENTKNKITNILEWQNENIN